MNLFEKAASKKTINKCINCDKEFTPDKRNVKRGWGLCCSKSCATTYKNMLYNAKGLDLLREIRNKKLSQLGINI